MKKTILTLISLLLPVIGSAQQMPHTFSDGDLIYAEQINENFEVAASGLRKGTVDCDAGESISEKLKEFNHLKISGTCTENVVIDFQKRADGPG